MGVLGKLAAVLLVCSAVSTQGSGSPEPEITKDLLREKIREFKNQVEGYVDDVRDLADDLAEKERDQFSSQESGDFKARVPDAFVDSAKLYTSTMEYARNAIEKLWLEIMNHNQGAEDGFETGYLKCSQLISFAYSYEWDGMSFEPFPEADLNRAWKLMAEDWKCLAYQFEAVFESCDKLTRRHEAGGMSLEDAVEGLGKLILGLTRLEDTGSLFYHAVDIFFPHLIPNFGALETGGGGTQSGGGGSPTLGGGASKRNILVRALEHMLKMRNDGNPPPTGPPPPSGGNPPPPPSGNGGGQTRSLAAILRKLNLHK